MGGGQQGVQRSRSWAVGRIAAGVLVLGGCLGLVGVGGCAQGPPGGPGGAAEGGLGEGDEVVARAEACLAAPRLPRRPDVLALAQQVEGHAAREAAGARAVHLHGLAANLYARVFRHGGEPRDGEEAVALRGVASRDVALPGACEAGLQGALLAGEVAHDAATTYAEVYRLERRARAASQAGLPVPTTCLAAIDDAKARVAAHRPADGVLAAIDGRLAAEGALTPLPPPSRGSPQVSSAPSPSPSAPVAQGPPRLLKVEHWPGRETARVVVTLDRPAPFRAGDEAGAGGAGPRTFVELDGVQLAAEARDAPGEGLVKHLRVEATSSGSRVSLDLAGHAYRRVFYLPEPYRVVMDLATNPPTAGGNARGGKRAVTRVVLDPGHGGTDPGAIGPAGVKEKDVTLDVAHRVAPVLARLGVEAVLTRDGDRFVSLEERTARANASAADLFVSIHCNAAENHGHRGIETYILDTTRDVVATRVAARENAASPTATQELGALLASMRLADHGARSRHLAELLQRAALASVGPAYPEAYDGGVHTAGFYVLVGARMPSVLFETSYVSNPGEEQWLASEDYRQRLADGIANAVRAFREGR